VIDALTIAVAGATLAVDRNIDECNLFERALIQLEWTWYGEVTTHSGRSEMYVTAEPVIKPTRMVDWEGTNA
jgi:hypothetical protein